MEEPWLATWFPQIRAADPTLAFDIGANAGTWTTLIKPQFYRVVSVEPDERCQPPEGVTYDRRAVWSHNDEARLFRRESALQSSLLENHDVGDGGNEVHVVNETPIQCVTLDSLAEQYGPPNFIKMDIEGGEVEALKGATANCFRRCLWLIEIHDTRQEVLRHMGRLGFPDVQIIEHPLENAAPGHEWMLAEPKR